MTLLYRYLIAPLAMLALPFLALLNGKVAEGLRLRRKSVVYPDFPSRPVWIHAASGEFEYAKSVIREIKQRDPQTPVVVTYFSPTYAGNVAKFPGVDFSLPLPLDLAGPVSAFLKRLNPRILLLARTDFWPELLGQTRKRGIPIHVFSYTQRAPGKMSFPARAVARWRLNMVDRIHCVSSEDKANVEALRVKTPADVLGDTRYDQVRFRLHHPKELPAPLKPEADVPCLIAGSTWAEDEKVLLAATAAPLAAKKLRLILVPHEPTADHIADLKSQLEARKITYALYSEGAAWPDRQVLLVDEVGWLAELYAWADMAFVGGSFKRTVHSVMEALGAGLKTFVGPLHANNREAIEFQNVICAGVAAVTVVHDGPQWRAELEKAGDLSAFREAFAREFAARLGATNRLVDSIKF